MFPWETDNEEKEEQGGPQRWRREEEKIGGKINRKETK